MFGHGSGMAAPICTKIGMLIPSKKKEISGTSKQRKCPGQESQ
jgi:hypothetical protein